MWRRRDWSDKITGPTWAHARLARRRETANKQIESWGENEAA